MTARLLTAIITSLIWEAILVAVWLWGLPLVGVELPLSALVLAMAVLGVYAVGSFHIGTRALRKKAVTGMSSMVGSQGRVVSPLTPEGTVMIGGELWTAKSVEGNIDKGQAVKVVGEEGLKLFVRKSDKAVWNE